MADPGGGTVPSGAPSPSALDHNGLDAYVRKLFAREDDCLREVRRRADAAGLPRIQLPPATARAVQLLLRTAGTKQVVEVGSLAGYSAVWIGRALPPDGRLTTLEIDPARADHTRRSVEAAGLAGRVEVRVGDAAETLATMGPAGSVDAVFLDADKERYAAYLEEGARLLRSGGLLMADNAFWKGLVLAPESSGDERAVLIDDFNQRLATDPRFEATILPVGDGLAVAVRR